MPVSHTFVALHYWAGSGCAFDRLRAALPAHTQLLAPDLPGFGTQSAPPDFDYSVAAYADWVAAYIQRNSLTSYTLLGHSMGGKIALALAARQPAGLRSLLLLSPSPPTPEPMSAADRAAARAAYGKPEEAAKTFTSITNLPLPEILRGQVIADNLRSSQTAWNAWLDHGSRENSSALMPKLDVPCQLLVGEHDRAISPATQRQATLPLLPPGTMLQLVPGAGHLLPLEAPLAVVAALGWAWPS
ncbi:alpha/beta hydrolase [Hymenobacter sp. ASUV-10]|uniref:Alpha/beta hydrolase n=1 Tax=Hymenobacter aranciens TaxID=3063996 RepID=A0ABT9BDZ4_9BACT|nr:alpha/beta hydrolase [Hymenobacter sp. ASUV-10]MDO7875919.1 alpha/beta hydrolase [Hymenobacter sp. ASUV-10]